MGGQSPGSHLIMEGEKEEKRFCRVLKTQGACSVGCGGKGVSDAVDTTRVVPVHGETGSGFCGCGRLIKQQGSYETLASEDRNVYKPHEVFILRGRAYQVSSPGLESKVLGF